MPERYLPIRPNRDAALPLREKRALLVRMRALQGAERSFVLEIARQARRARGRMDDDVYGIIGVTLGILQQAHGVPPPLAFAVTHYETGRIEQVGFLPPGVTQMPRGGQFVTNDPRFRPSGALPPGGTRRIEG